MARRNTFRRQCCLGFLAPGPMLFTELKWRVWNSEWTTGRTKFVCPKSAHFSRGFKRSIQSWAEQGFMKLSDLDEPITYGAAARLAVFTALGRGQLSAPEPEAMIRLYFHGALCSTVVSLDGMLSVNLGAIFTGNSARYRVVCLSGKFSTETNIHKAKWPIRLSVDGKEIDPAMPLPKTDTPQWRSQFPNPDTTSEESYAPEGVALSLRHSNPGKIVPYMLTGENFTRQKDKFDC